MSTLGGMTRRRKCQLETWHVGAAKAIENRTDVQILINLLSVGISVPLLSAPWRFRAMAPPRGNQFHLANIEANNLSTPKSRAEPAAGLVHRDKTSI
jgi:hypothetical protein